MPNAVFLDACAGQPLCLDSIARWISEARTEWGLDSLYNPSGAYQPAQNSKRLWTQAKAQVSSLILGDLASEYECVVTSSGTESNQTAARLFSVRAQEIESFTYCIHPLDHASLWGFVPPSTNAAPMSRVMARWDVDLNGWVYGIKGGASVSSTRQRSMFFSINLVHGESGLIQEFPKHYPGLQLTSDDWIHMDVTQATGTQSLSFINDYKYKPKSIACSAHKWGGMPGCAFLWIHRSVIPHKKEAPLLQGSQEFGLRGGTENILGLLWSAEALRRSLLVPVTNISTQLKNVLRADSVIFIDEWLNQNIESSFSWAPHILPVAVRGKKAKDLQIALDLRGIQVGVGSACRSQIPDPSPGLLALGVPEELLRGYLRFSSRQWLSSEDLQYIQSSWRAIL